MKDLFPDWREVLKRSRQSGGEQPAQGNAQTGAPSAPGRKLNQFNVPDTNDNQSCDSDMESLHSSADRDPSAPDHDSTNVKDTLGSSGPDAKPTAYDEAMGRYWNVCVTKYRHKGRVDPPICQTSLREEPEANKERRLT